MSKVLVIIPAYNEQENIFSTIECAKKYNYDVCVVNDCSTDDTYRICSKDKDIAVISLSFNLGIGGAVQTGYLYAYENGYDYAIQLDGDGQHNPYYIDVLLRQLQMENADMAIGSRFLKKDGFQSTKMRRIGIKFFSCLIWMLYHYRIYDTTSGFRLVNRKLIQLFAKRYPIDYPEPETNAALIRKKYKIVECPVIMHERFGGESSIKALGSFWYMLKVTFAILIDWLRGRKEQ